MYTETFIIWLGPAGGPGPMKFIAPVFVFCFAKGGVSGVGKTFLGNSPYEQVKYNI